MNRKEELVILKQLEKDIAGCTDDEAIESLNRIARKKIYGEGEVCTECGIRVSRLDANGLCGACSWQVDLEREAEDNWREKHAD